MRLTVRTLAFVLAAAGCNVGLSSTADDDPGPTDESGGGLPPAACGTGHCSECVGCEVRNGLCFGGYLTLGAGSCVAAGMGSFTATVGGAAFSATNVASIVDGAYAEVSARGADRSITFELPATIGTFDCSAGASVELAYFDATGDYWSRLISPRLPCTVTVTAVGDVGGTIDGTISATLETTGTTATAIDVVNGTFSARRSAYP